MAPLCVLIPHVTLYIKHSASRPIAARSCRKTESASRPTEVELIATKYGCRTVAESLIRSSDRSLCAPDPRRSTSPGFGVSSASAINDWEARLASRRDRSAARGEQRRLFLTESTSRGSIARSVLDRSSAISTLVPIYQLLNFAGGL